MANSKLLLAAVKESVAVLRVVCPRLPAHVEADQEHDQKVDQQRHGDHQHVQRFPDNLLALEAEHDENREQQGDERKRADLRNEFLLVPRPSFGLDQNEPREHAGQERDAQVDEDAPGDAADRHLRAERLFIDGQGKSEFQGQDHDEEVRVNAVEEDLEDAVEGHQAGAVLGVALGQLVPDDDHRDAAGQTDENQSGHELRLTAKKQHCKGEHEHRAHEPVLQQGKPQDLPVR